MTTLLLLNRGFSTSHLILPNNRRSVSDMDEKQRKAVMAKLGGGGGAAGGYTGGARGGRRGPERKPTPMYVTPEGHARAVREAQIGIQSDITPFDLLASTALESGLDGINQARMNTDNKWVDAALGVAALGLFAAGVKNARTQQALAKHVSAQKTVDQVLEQMGRDAARFSQPITPVNVVDKAWQNTTKRAAETLGVNLSDPVAAKSLERALVKTKGEFWRIDKQSLASSSVGDDIYRTYDQIAERVTRARGYPPSAAEANRWLDKAAPRVTSPSVARNPTVIEQVNAFKADTLSKTGIAATDNDVSTFLLQKHPGTYTPPKTYIPPTSAAGDVFRSEAAKNTGRQQAQLLDYARRADMDSVVPRMVKDPWQSTKDVISRIDIDEEMAYRAQPSTAKRPSVYEFVDDDPEFYRWYEYGGKPRPKPLSDAELNKVIGNKESHMHTLLVPGLRLIKNAMRVTRGFIANAGPMTDEQRRAMFASGGRGPARRSSSSSIGRINGSTQNFNSSYSTSDKPFSVGYMSMGPIGMKGSVATTQPGVGNRKPIDFKRFDQVTSAILETFPDDKSGLSIAMKGLLEPYRNNPSAFADNPESVKKLYDLVSMGITYTTGSNNYTTKRSAMESLVQNEALNILHAAGKMQDWTANTTSGTGGYSGVYFTYHPGTRGSSDAPMPREVMSPPGQYLAHGQEARAPVGQPKKVSTPAYTPPNNKGVGTYNPNQPYVPGQPRIDERGNKIYGPKPGEPGFIDIGKWRGGANPKGPISQPTPVKKK